MTRTNVHLFFRKLETSYFIDNKLVPAIVDFKLAFRFHNGIFLNAFLILFVIKTDALNVTSGVLKNKVRHERSALGSSCINLRNHASNFH